MRITAKVLQAIGVPATRIDEHIDPINGAILFAKLSTSEQVAAFIANAAYETGFFLNLTENLNYTEERILQVFGRRITPAQAKLCARNPNKLGDWVYANRNGNGGVESGDGFRFRGRGYFHTTGRANYKALNGTVGRHILPDGSEADIDFTKKPLILSDPTFAALSAAQYWIDNKLSSCESFEAICIKINGGENGLDARKQIYTKLLNALKTI
ncbi:putative chitinase [Pseudarcicella hirudinis]|uniref:Putative chitinase n=1 Tax=Pseudarcicella hirudinis TaxID=1079859 RepID=A0A1I5MXM3_9BACT|nr:hypothetical protein [Pseudarcicella hirudinis]SFP14107.1 putative chitinase [Pseudarcicella hirudinis]